MQQAPLSWDRLTIQIIKIRFMVLLQVLTAEFRRLAQPDLEPIMFKP